MSPAEQIVSAFLAERRQRLLVMVDASCQIAPLAAEAQSLCYVKNVVTTWRAQELHPVLFATRTPLIVFAPWVALPREDANHVDAQWEVLRAWQKSIITQAASGDGVVWVGIAAWLNNRWNEIDAAVRARSDSDAEEQVLRESLKNYFIDVSTSGRRHDG